MTTVRSIPHFFETNVAVENLFLTDLITVPSLRRNSLFRALKSIHTYGYLFYVGVFWHTRVEGIRKESEGKR